MIPKKRAPLSLGAEYQMMVTMPLKIMARRPEPQYGQPPRQMPQRLVLHFH